MTADRTVRGTIFNIQKYSVNDGPGIRTVVFFKGCPLRCRWCSNPESQLAKPQVIWNSKTCIHCHHCISTCEHEAVRTENDRMIIDFSRCVLCQKCISECPTRSLKKEGEEKTVQQVLDVVLQDLPFYQESNGGITLSGGEVFSQAEFARNLLLAAKEEGLDTCIETTGFCRKELFEEMIRYVDHLLIDMKHYDSQKHREYTGVPNEAILENISLALQTGIDVTVRVPVIPGFNDSLTDAGKMADKMTELGVRKCQLLPFHQFGENKYGLLNREYEYENVEALHREDLADYLQIFTGRGIEAFF